MLKYFPDFDNLDLYSDVQLLDPRFEDDSDKNDEQPSLGLCMAAHMVSGDMLKVFVGYEERPLCFVRPAG
jgi:hypothetical protein